MIESAIYGKTMTKVGILPAIILVNPKYPHNVGAAVRAASCFGYKQVWFTGDRVSLDPAKGERLPREERMKGYKDVQLRQSDYPFEQFDKGVPKIAVELRQGATPLQEFIHPEKAVYVFGPEDGSLGKPEVNHCHQFLVLPTRHCVNLAAAVYMVLMHRLLQMHDYGVEEIPPMDELLREHRGPIETEREKQIEDSLVYSR